MGEATVMVHAILTIVGIILATVFAAYVLGRMGYVNSVMSGVLNSKLEEIQSEIKIVAGFYNGSSEYDIFVKNVGSVDMPEDQLYNKTEVYVGTYDTFSKMYLLSNTSSSNTAQLVDLNGDNVWSSGETVVIKIPPPSTDTSAPVRVKIVLPSGSTAEAVLTG
jgi:flagellar protein FlaG